MKKVAKLKDVLSKIGSGATPRGGANVYLEQGVSLIRSQNIGHGDFLLDGLVHIDDEAAQKLDNVKVETLDVLLNITGDSVARSAIVVDSILPARVNQHVAILRANTEFCEPQYLRYWVQSRYEFLLQQSEIGATRRALTKGMLEELSITLPPLPEQRRIAGILSAFDDKIDVLRRQNATLEGMAQAVFREWFVERREDDWEEVSVGDLATHVKHSIKPGNLSQETFVHYSLPAFDDGKRPVSELGLEIRSNKYEVPSKSILVSKLNPRFPRVWWIDEAPQNAVCSTEFQVVKPKDVRHTAFLLSFLMSRYASDALMMSASGTSGSHQRVRPKDIFDLSIPMPSENSIIEFQKLIWPKMEKAIKNRVAIETTEKLKSRALKNLL